MMGLDFQQLGYGSVELGLSGTWKTTVSGDARDYDIDAQATGKDMASVQGSLSASDVPPHLVLAMLLAYAARMDRSPITSFANRVASLGYAMPGTVLAVGLLTPLATFDNALASWTRETLGVSTGLLLSGSLFAVTLALVIRFLAVALGTIEAGIARISPNIDAAARTLGATEQISVADALRTITLGAAYTFGLDDEIGSIEVGKLADFAVLEDDPSEIGGDRLKDVRVWGTVQGGRLFPAPAI